MKILFAASEAYPLIKTGGLGDVANSLPNALSRLGMDVRLLLPGYRDVLRQLDSIRILGWLEVRSASSMASVRLLEARNDAFDFPVLIADCPALFDRPGNPYVSAAGQDWPDNAERFAVFARAATQVAMDETGLGWKADVVHANDWQTGLIPAFLNEQSARPHTVFTIHNLAYGGYFTHGDFIRLQLPGQWWSSEGAEFYGSFSMLKAGIVYADAVTTVSPTYAQEIRTPAFGYGLDGLLDSRASKLHGILNGIDTDVWNPASDKLLAAHYSINRLNPGKRRNKQALLEKFLPEVSKEALEAPLLGMVGRMVEQKGMDWVLAAIPAVLKESNARFVLLGSGDTAMEKKFKMLAKQNPDRVMVFIGYDEALAHLVEAGADMFLMPSRFEPCGLNQMYSLRYGTPPIVYKTGGLADTVVDATPESLSGGSANGFVFDSPGVDGLTDAIRRGITLMRRPTAWRKLVRTGMAQDFSWDDSARRYVSLYAGKNSRMPS